MKEPWEPSYATDAIREMAQNIQFSIAYKIHAKERLSERGLIASDVLYLLKNGFGLKPATKSEKSPGYYKYQIESLTPNSGGRKLRAVVIPNCKDCKLKIVTIMWVDERATRSGTLLENTDD